ncbi:cation:proton antiporter [Saccharicrinis sp. FJH62]|uniref:cation:proton antiporter n=1 Tax=Saccharicrinis sp. FJH62 TaxID=3344657 RepID=UPI0035D4008E
MQPILIYGIIIIAGYVAGIGAQKAGLPRVTGYLLVGLILNPQITSVIPEGFIDNTEFVTNISLAFITLSVGGTLKMSELRKMGKTILLITVMEAEVAFIMVSLGFYFLFPYLGIDSSLAIYSLPIGLILGSLACPTDPSATLAVTHEYKAKGEVSSTILGVAAFDDIAGILNYSIFIVLAATMMTGQSFSFHKAFMEPAYIIGGSIVLGIIMGTVFNLTTRFSKKLNDGVLILMTFGFLMLAFGLAELIKVDELLATMTMGIAIANFNPKQDRIFKILEGYTEELIFVLFFVISSMHLNFSVVSNSYWLIIIFIILRAMGKFMGTFSGAIMVKADRKVRHFTAGGLLPQGGIVIGLALMIKQNDSFSQIADMVISIVIGATIVHEIIGPVMAKFFLVKAGEIKKETESNT